MKKKKLVGLILAIIISSSSMTACADAYGDTYIKNGSIVESENFTSNDDFTKIKPLDENYNMIYDYGKGFAMKYPNNMNVDTKLSEVKTVMSNKDMTIEVFYDSFYNTPATSQAYINYSNGFMKNTKDHKKEYESHLKIRGRKVHVLKWSRDKLDRVENDKNYYISAEIEKNDKEVYTVFMKSSTPFPNYESYMDIINSFNLIEKKATPKINTTFKQNNRKFNKETEDFYNKYFLKSDKLKWGIFEYTTKSNMDFLNQLENRIDYELDFLVRYQSLSNTADVPLEELKMAYSENKFVELTLQTIYNDDRDNSSVQYDILKGKYDDYLNKYARDIKSFGHPVLFRFNNEMNGDWCLYSSYHFSKDTEIFKETWKYVYSIFEKNGVDNALWVWNPHDGSFPNFNWNHYLNYYPGDEYVDIVGLTGYNAGTYYPGETWRGFKEIYDPLYDEYVGLFEQPLMITEFGSNSVGGDKIAWINEMFDTMKKYDRIKVAIWWNGIDWDPDKNPARIYRLDQSEAMLDTFKNRLQEYK